MLFNKDLGTTMNFLMLPREEFFNIHNYYTGLEYDIFEDLFFQDLVNNVVNVYNEILKQRKSLRNFYIIGLQHFINKLSKSKQEKINQIINL